MRACVFVGVGGGSYLVFVLPPTIAFFQSEPNYAIFYFGLLSLPLLSLTSLSYNGSHHSKTETDEQSTCGGTETEPGIKRTSCLAVKPLSTETQKRIIYVCYASVIATDFGGQR